MGLDTQASTVASDARARDAIAFADGALGAAGHEVTDPFARSLMERVARGEVSGDEAVAQLDQRDRDR